MEEMRFQ